MYNNQQCIKSCIVCSAEAPHSWQWAELPWGGSVVGWTFAMGGEEVEIGDIV